MRPQIVDRQHAASRHHSVVTYAFALFLQAAFFYCGFRYVLNPDIPPVYRLIAGCVCFPLAVVAAGWGGHIALIRRGEKHYAIMQLFETLPIRILLGVFLASIVVTILNFAGAF